MKKVLFYCLIFSVSSAFVLNNSNRFSDLVRSKLSTYANKHWPEKVYVHTDKPYYSLDEDLWFSTYLVNGITHEESTKSSVVYVELINEADSIVKSKRLFIDTLSVGGHFKINNNWSPGNYLLRAYTSYMRNENPQIFFQKEIQIVALDSVHIQSKNDSISTQTSSLNLDKPDLQFFPEGGYLVENINSKVAIKIMNPQYHNYKIPIEIVDSKGTVLSQFNSVEFGLGSFYINPKSGQDYYANLSLNGIVHQYKLPDVLAQGFGLNINFRANELLIGLNSTKKNGLKNAYLMIHQRGKPLFDRVLTTSEKTDIISLYTGNLKAGVTHITLFNDQGKPVCERLVFIDSPENDVSVLIDKNKQDFKSREKVTLDLKIQNNTGNQLSGNLSLSVRDLEAVPEIKNAPNIKTWLLLNSDLRGKIDDPNYFFSKGEPSKKKYVLDLVMMTNGWRRFTWQKIFQENATDNTFEIEKGITITGTTTSLDEPIEPVKAINTITFLGDQTIELQNTSSDKNGKFSFGPYVFYDSIPTLVESKLVDPTIKTSEDLRKVSILIDDRTSERPKIERPQISTYSHKTMTLNDDFLQAAEYMRNLNLEYDGNSQRLKEVVLTATKKTKAEEREEEMENRSFFGSPSKRLDIASDIFLSRTELRLIFQNFPGVRVGSLHLYYRGEISKIFYNNMIVDLDFVSSLNPADISFIDFYDPANAVYNRAPGGVFIIYGKLGVDRTNKSISRLPGIINFTSTGFDGSKEFYAPDYSKNLDQMTKSDVRTTLHWEPKIRLTEDQSSKEVSFYSCDMKGTYRIEVEGITDDGIPVYEIDYFYVN